MAFGGLGGGGGGGGVSLGTAVANIIVNASQLMQLPQVVRNVARQVNSSFGGMGQGLVTFSTNVKKIQNELLALGASTGILTKIGFEAAGGIQEAKIQLEGMTGSAARAQALMDQLRKRATQAGLPFAAMLQAAKQLLPTLQGNTKELDKYINLARRVATLNPQQGIAGAAFSINEALVSQGSDLVSLAERFNISRRAVQQEMQRSGGDFASALDTILNKMGITEEAADKMGKTFNAALTTSKDAAVQLLATGMEPLLNTITPLLQGTTSLLNNIGQAHPIFAQMTSGILAAVTAGIALTLVISNITNALSKMKNTGAFGGVAGKVGAGLGIIGTAAAVGFGAGNMVRSAQGQETVTPEQVGKTVAHYLMEGVAALYSGLNHIDEIWANAVDSMIQSVGRLVTALGSAVESIGNLIPGSAGNNITTTGRGMIASGLRMQTSTPTMDTAQKNEQNRIESYNKLGNFLGVWTDTANTSAASIAAKEAEESQKRIDSVVQWQHDVDHIEHSAHQARLQALADFERQQAETIANFNLQQSRQAQDDMIADQRAQQGLQDQKDNIRSDQADQEEQWQEELGKTIADKRQESADKLLEMEQDYNKQRERDAEDHRDKLLDAAANLDAAAVSDEQRRFAKDQNRAAEDYAEKVKKEQDNTDKDIEREQKAADDRLEKSRHAEERRLEELDAAFQKQQGLEQADRTLRDTRAQEDRDRALKAQQDAYDRQKAQIDAQEQESLTAAAQANMDRLSDMGQALESQRIMEQKYQENALKRWGLFYGSLDELNKKTLEARPLTKEQAEAGGNIPSLLDPYKNLVDNYNKNKSGAVPGLYPGSGKYDPNNPNTYPGMLDPWLQQQNNTPGGVLSPVPQPTAFNAAPRSMNISIAERAVVVEEAATPEATGAVVYGVLADILRKHAEVNGYG